MRIRDALDWWVVALGVVCTALAVVACSFAIQQCHWQEACEKAGGRVVEYDCSETLNLFYIDDMPFMTNDRSCSHRCEGIDR